MTLLYYAVLVLALSFLVAAVLGCALALLEGARRSEPEEPRRDDEEAA